MSQFQPYRPVVPEGLPPERALPVPGRPKLRGVLVWVALVVVTGGCGLLTVAQITSVTGVLGLVTGAVLAAIPVVPVVAAFLWLDRYEAEPASLLAFAFALGRGRRHASGRSPSTPPRSRPSGTPGETRARRCSSWRR